VTTGRLSAIFRALQFAYPPSFRREYESSMRHDFNDAVSHERSARGPAAALAFALGAYADLLAAAVREHVTMLLRDVMFALRSLRKTPLFTAIVIVTFALAIAANGAVFSIVRTVVFEPLPYPAADRLAAVLGTKDGAPFALSLPDFNDARRTPGFASIAAFSPRSATLTGRGLPQRVYGITTTPGLFETLGVPPLLGRTFTNSDAQTGSARSAVISETLWRSAFGADSHAIGALLELDGVAYRVIGIVPASLRQPNFDEPDLEGESFWLPLDPSSKEDRYGRGAHYFQAIGRLRPGVSLENARADLSTRFARLAVAYPVEDKHYGVAVRSAYESIVGDVRPLLLAIFAAVAGVLLVACANVANLLLGRAATREREFAIRSAVGASRGRLVTQLLVETFVFAAIGGTLGSGLAVVAVRTFVASHPAGLPRLADVRFDMPSAVFTLAIVLLCTLVASIAPAFAMSRNTLARALTNAGRGGDASRGARTRSLLIILEVALTLALVVSSGLVLRSFYALTVQPLGFDPAGVTAALVQVPANAREGAPLRAVLERIEARVRALPGVDDVAWSYSAPFTRRSFESSFELANRRAQPGESPSSQINIVGPDYFATLRERLLAGRSFGRNDVGHARVVIVNEAFTRRFLAGRRTGSLVLGISDGPPRPAPIVGVVADARNSYAVEAGPTIYVPIGSIGTPNVLLLMRSHGAAPTASDLGAIFTAVDSLAARPKLTPFSTYLANDTARTRLAAQTLGALAFVALVLSLAGIFAVVSYGVTQRTHEFGVRMALGARAWHVIRSAVGNAMRLVAIGVALGIVIAASTTHLLASQLYSIAPLDPLTFGAVAAALVLAAFLAALVPASRATRVDPIVALRYD
jgi:predicted permease